MEQTIEQESIWLSDRDLEKLTGCKKQSLQIEYLREQGIAFRINRLGEPVVSKDAAKGVQITQQAKPKWQPSLVGK
ncbi:DUF4224 domain-containing protein [Nitrosomonas communis]|uniref:DUF4224 domain-containing protein n=1 Tax=Nitrosomonas communis TaxID=44574 RepID=UPI003D2B1BD1